MGVLAPGSAHPRPSAQPPINTSGNFSAQVSGRAWVNNKNVINFLNISGDSGQKSVGEREKKERKNAINSGHLVP